MRPQHEHHFALPVAGLLSIVLVLTGLFGTAGSLPTASAASPAAATQSAQAAAKTVAVKKSAKKAAAKKAKIKKAKQVRALKLKRLAKRYPRTAAKKMMTIRGYSRTQQSCVIKLWNKESNWRWWAANPSSSAYGIPQALPGRKMASAGADWRTNPVTQIRWGLKYIKDRYGSPCAAWRHSQARNWY